MSDKSSSGVGDDVVEVNVGGVMYTTSRRTLVHEQESVLAKWFGSTDTDDKPLGCDAHGRYFIDRDGALFRYIIDDTDSHQSIRDISGSENHGHSAAALFRYVDEVRRTRMKLDSEHMT